jgi:hypothetical protein
MRIGSNPQKSERKIVLTTNHRVIVVVYIPNKESFYKNSFDVFKMCLDSLVSTIDSNCALTIVNNGSHKEVSDLLNAYLIEKKIDTLITHNINIGKIDASIGAARGVREKYITLTDADILFAKGWQEKTEEVFLKFPNVGSVSPIPIRTGLYYGTSSVLKQIIFRKLKFKYIPIPENFTSYNKFLESINWDLEIQDDKNWCVVEKNGYKANIGSSHQILTIDRDILFKTTPTNPSLTLVGGNSEYKYVDEAIDKSGKLRLSTYNNFAFHMGNKLESWMIDVQNDNTRYVKNNEENPRFSSQLTDMYNTKLKDKYYGLRKKIVKNIFSILYKNNI